MRRAATISAALVVLLAMAVPAVAKTDRIAFSGEDTLVEQGVPARYWESDDGILHARGSVSTYTSTSDSDFYGGDLTIVVNYNLDPATGKGTLWGTSHLEVDGDGGFDGTWTGKFTGTETVWVGHGRSKGYGSLDGYQQRYDLAWAWFGDVVEGFTFMPGNKG
jgi:hypothetical protein